MALIVQGTTVPHGIWYADKAHSEIGFTVRHSGISKVRGKFDHFEASLKTGEDFGEFDVEAIIEAASFDSGNTDRDNHVRSADFFDVETYPNLIFDAEEITQVDEDNYLLKGNLTIRGETQPVTLKTELGGIAVDPFGNTRLGVSATTAISRKQFGLVWNAVLETGGLLVGDKVEIQLELSFVLDSADNVPD